MTAGVILTVLFVTLVLGVVTTAVLQENRAYRRRLLEAVDSRPAWRSDLVQRADERLRRSRLGARFAALLAGSGLVTWSPTLALLGVVGSGVLGVLVTQPLVGRYGSVAFGVAVVLSFKRWLDHRRQARIEKFVGQLPELARLLANGASAGLGVTRSIELAAREMDEPASAELAQLSSELAVGQPLAAALHHLSERLPSRELLVLVQTLVIQGKAGGALVSALSNIAATLDERRKLRREIKTATVGAAFSGYAVILIGVGSLFLMNVISPGSLDIMLGTLLGRIVVIAALGLFAIGFVAIQRLTKVDV